METLPVSRNPRRQLCCREHHPGFRSQIGSRSRPKPSALKILRNFANQGGHGACPLRRHRIQRFMPAPRNDQEPNQNHAEPGKRRGRPPATKKADATAAEAITASQRSPQRRRRKRKPQSSPPPRPPPKPSSPVALQIRSSRSSPRRPRPTPLPAGGHAPRLRR